MKIDQTHRRWMQASVAFVILTTLWFVYLTLHGRAKLNGPSGASVTGLVYGGIGLGFMIFAGLLGGRKRLRSWRLGRVQWWMRGHLWLGTLALVAVCFHGGFHWGGALTWCLMLLLWLVVLSGWLGAILQHVLPQRMTDRVGNETIYEEIPRVLGLLQDEAQDVAGVCGPLGGEPLEVWRQERTAGIMDRERRELITRGRRDELLQAVKGAPATGSAALARFYVEDVAPYLRGQANGGQILSNFRRMPVLFEQKRNIVPENLHPALNDLERICRDRRQLSTQRRYQHWLHRWMLVHVPLSIVLLVLSIVHAVWAFKYSAIKPF